MFRVLMSLFLIINLIPVHASESEEERKEEKRLIEKQIKTQTELDQNFLELKQVKERREQRIRQSFTDIDVKIAELPREIVDIILNNFFQILDLRLINKTFENLTRKYIQENFTLNLGDFKISEGIKYYEPLSQSCVCRSSQYLTDHKGSIDNFELYHSYHENFFYIRSNNSFDYCEYTVLSEFIKLKGFLRPKHVILYYTCNITYQQIKKFVENNPQIESLKIIMHHQKKRRTIEIMEKISTLQQIKSLNLEMILGYTDDSTLNLALKIPANKIIVNTFFLGSSCIETLFQNPKLTSFFAKNSNDENSIDEGIIRLLFKHVQEKPLEKLKLWNVSSRYLDEVDLKTLSVQNLKIKGTKENYFFKLKPIAQNCHLKSLSFYYYGDEFSLDVIENFMKEKRQNLSSILKKIKIYYSDRSLLESLNKTMTILNDEFQISFKKI